MITIGAYNKFRIVVTNDGTDLPEVDVSLVNDLDITLYTEQSKAIAKYGTTNKPIENPSPGVFDVEIAAETSELLRPFIGDIAYLEGFIKPYNIPFQVDLGKVEDNIASHD